MPRELIPATEAEAALQMQELPGLELPLMQDQKLTLTLKQKENQIQVLPE